MGPVGLVQFDSHTDLNDSYFGGTRYTHAPPFRRIVEEGLVDPKRFVQVGIHGTLYDEEGRDFATANGIRLILIEEFHARGPEDVMAEVHDIVGTCATYVTYDIDFVDPAFAPGTDTPETGGPNSYQALQVVRMLEGWTSSALTWPRSRRPSMPRVLPLFRAFLSCSNCCVRLPSATVYPCVPGSRNMARLLFFLVKIPKFRHQPRALPLRADVFAGKQRRSPDLQRATDAVGPDPR
jgi:hypothetical protein